MNKIDVRKCQFCHHNKALTIMQNIVESKFLSISPEEREQLKESVNRFVTHDNFSNIIHDNACSDPSSIHLVCSQLEVFNTVPGLLKEVQNWLNSV
jgi:hypothetical protein